MKNDYLYTAIHKSVDDFKPQNDSTYIYGVSAEDRSHFVETLISRKLENVNYLELRGLEDEKVIEVGSETEIHLRSSISVKKAIGKFHSNNIYIDVTGLDNRICAAFIKNAMEMHSNSDVKKVIIVYAEPDSYDIKQFKTESVFNDLSERIDGISPLPGFATIFPQDEEKIFLIALLGFEGGRFSHMLESVQPPKENVIPIIGVPGFRPEYPYVAYWGNNRPLKETETWRKVKFASANSLVEVYMLLSKILKKNPNFKIKLAPIGTKPHAIAAMLFAIKYPRFVELVYDNPKRQKRRTAGIGNVVECIVSKLIVEN
ncbi:MULTISPECIES: hypothetical protein [Sphingobacterium]|uniref:hypothetical protein n=1 Tax=Sphingobacterium TaxID=28453 RepID=UPI00257C563B|nr:MULTISPECIES: hypothetical protein [Sphingobacterium]